MARGSASRDQAGEPGGRAVELPGLGLAGSRAPQCPPVEAPRNYEGSPRNEGSPRISRGLLEFVIGFPRISVGFPRILLDFDFILILILLCLDFDLILVGSRLEFGSIRLGFCTFAFC